MRARQTSIKNRIRHVAAEYNADREDLFTSEGLKYLRGLKLDPVDRWLVQRLLRELKLYRDELKAVDRQLAAFARTAPAAEARQRKLLDSIPAVGPVTRETFLAEVAGPERFGSQKKLTSYVGLAPGQRESAGKPPRPGHHAQRLADSALGAAPGRLATGAAARRPGD
ncbi:MAG: IS110 family transposase [Phycisphaerales bacterium]|nr:IS110 family transposase [Phycisphaerales bacterium]